MIHDSPRLLVWHYLAVFSDDLHPEHWLVPQRCVKRALVRGGKQSTAILCHLDVESQQVALLPSAAQRADSTQALRIS